MLTASFKLMSIVGHETDMPTALRDVRFSGAKWKAYARIELFRFLTLGGHRGVAK